MISIFTIPNSNIPGNENLLPSHNMLSSVARTFISTVCPAGDDDKEPGDDFRK